MIWIFLVGLGIACVAIVVVLCRAVADEEMRRKTLNPGWDNLPSVIQSPDGVLKRRDDADNIPPQPFPHGRWTQSPATDENKNPN